MSSSDMEQTPFLAHPYSDNTAVESRSPHFESDEDFDRYFLYQENLGLKKRRRLYTTSRRVWLKLKWLATRCGQRRAILLVLSMVFILQIIIFLLSDLSRKIASVHLPIVAPSVDNDPALEAQASDQLRRKLVPIKSHMEFLKNNSLYLEAWVARGEVLPGLDFGQYDKIDGLWSW